MDTHDLKSVCLGARRQWFGRVGTSLLRLFWVCFFLGFLEFGFPNVVFSSDPELDFQTQVLPLLQTHCLECHSHDAGVMEGDLALDWKSGWEVGGQRGPAIIPGDVDGSLLIQAIRHSHDELEMPAEKLPDEVIQVFERWVRDGAPDPRVSRPASEASDPLDWWSLRPLVRPAVPSREIAGTVSDASNPIDAFLEDRYAELGLKPAPQALPRELVRRLSVDIRGIQPSFEEVVEFQSHPTENQWARLVEQMLGSPQYGERWARHWFDTIHFADSHGFEHDVFRPNAWPFRDYVIQALNADMPWAEFVCAQLAADHFSPGDPHANVALGFLGAGPYDQSAAATAPKSFEYLDRDDLVTQVSAAFLSTTANCARCHSHKFDPISQEDYFSLQAVFAGIGKGDIPYDRDPDVAAKRRYWTRVKDLAAKGTPEEVRSDEFRPLVEKWEASKPPSWESFETHTFVSTGGADLMVLDDKSILSGGPRPDTETVVVTGTSGLQRITAVRLEVMTDPSLPMTGPGRQDNGNLHLNEFVVEHFTNAQLKSKKLSIASATADFNQQGWTVAHAIDGDPKTAWGIYPAVGQSHMAVFQFAEPIEFSEGDRLAITLRQTHGDGHVIGRFRIAVTDGPLELVSVIPHEVQAIIETPSEERTEESETVLRRFIIDSEATRELKKLPPQDKVYAAGAVAENERGIIRYETPRTIRVLSRGDIEKPRDEVMPGALGALLHLNGRFKIEENLPESRRRAALAEWIVHPDNPLSWRSIANRVWHYHFGRGLCDTPSDFGRMGGEPSHPELLDWLACELRDHGGSLKHLHRLICTSRVYRQTSQVTAADLTADQDNRYLARMVRRRMDADTYRDSVLAVASELDNTMGGPGIKQFSESPGPQVTPVLDYSNFDLSSAGATRRSIYRVVWRGIPDPLMESLDFPDLGLLAPVRNVSSSPLQALTLRNHRFPLHHAQRFADFCSHRFDSDVESMISEAVRRVWLREPSPDEVRNMQLFVSENGMAALCRALLASNEFLYVP